MAAPHVAGAFAALKSAVPEATPNEMIDALRHTGHRVFDARNGRSTQRIRVDEAIEKLRKTIAARPGVAEPEPAPEPEARAQPETEAQPEPGLAAEEKPESQAEEKPSPKSEDINGIRIERDPVKIGEDGKIEW